MLSSKEIVRRRAWRIRNKLKRCSNGRLRLSVYRSNMNIYAQIIDDRCGNTVVSASTLDKDLKNTLKSGKNIDAAREIGKILADRAQKANIEEVVFDRGPYIYHGRVKALAEAVREGGIKF